MTSCSVTVGSRGVSPSVLLAPVPSHCLSWLPEADQEKVKTAKIKALRGLAAREYNAPNRNYYLSVANELESGEASELQKAFEY